MTFLVIAGEKIAGDEAPDNWGIAATLTSTMDRKFHTLSIRFFGDSAGYFQFKNGIFKRGCVDKNSLSVDAKAASRQTCKRH